MANQPNVLEVEEAVGSRCDFFVRYERNGRKRYDGIYAESAEDAEEKFRAFATELGWNVENVTVEARDS